MSTTNTVTPKTTTFATSISNFFQTISNTNVLNYALYNGVGGIPYATFGLVAAVIGVLVYATVTDEIEELKEGLTQMVPLEQIAAETNKSPEEPEQVEENTEQEVAEQQEDANLNADAEQKENQEEEKQQEEKAKKQEEEEQEQEQEEEEESEEEPGERYKVGGKSKRMRYRRRRTQKRSRSNRD